MKRLMSTLFVIAVATHMAVAGDKPDFSGTWKLDLEKSMFAPIPAPESMMRTVNHKDPDISVQQTLTGPEMDMRFKYSTDGKETPNNFMGTDFKSKANWDGKTLVIRNDVDGGRASRPIHGASRPTARPLPTCGASRLRKATS
jgi:hypothetical protein